MLGRLAYAALFLVSLQSAAFFIGEADAEGRIPVLCEDAPEVFVSTPAGNTVLLELAGHQAVFSPAFPGPYIVQCGNETKEVAVQGSSEAQGGLPGRGDSCLISRSEACFWQLRPPCCLQSTCLPTARRFQRRWKAEGRGLRYGQGKGSTKSGYPTLFLPDSKANGRKSSSRP